MRELKEPAILKAAVFLLSIGKARILLYVQSRFKSERERKEGRERQILLEIIIWMSKRERVVGILRIAICPFIWQQKSCHYVYR